MSLKLEKKGRLMEHEHALQIAIVKMFKSEMQLKTLREGCNKGESRE